MGAVFSLARHNARAQDPPKVDIDKIQIVQKLNAQVPLDLTFRDETGKTVRLGEYFGKRPVVLMLIFYRCRGYCAMEMDGALDSLRAIKKERVGTDFDVLTVSIHPKETPDEAAANKKSALQRYNRPGAEAGWHSLVGDMPNIRKLADSVGFNFMYNEQKDQVVHPAGLMVLTPSGQVSQYYYGVKYPQRPMRESLLAAARSKIGTVVEQPILLGCLQYDPKTGKARLVVMQTLKVSGILTLVILGSSILMMSVRHRRTTDAAQSGKSRPTSEGDA